MDLKQLLALMVERKGEILHLVGGSPPLMKSPASPLSPLTGEALSVNDVKLLLEDALSPMQKEMLWQFKEISTAYSVEGLSRFRATIFHQRGTLAGVFKLTPPNPASLEELGLPPVLKDIVVKPQGLVLLTGPKGSGKSQTLAALLNYLLETRPVQIVSIENPIEFLLRNKKGVIYQREIGTDTPGFSQALRTALRQNPDVLALSELPDLETVGSVLAAASAGQLVIATVTANGILMTLEQMIELAPPHYQQALRSQLGAGFEIGISQLLLTKKQGGLVPAYEILIGSVNVKNTIREAKIPQLLQIMNNSRDLGMVSQEVALKNLHKKNLIDMEEAMAKAVRPEELKRLAALPI